MGKNFKYACCTFIVSDDQVWSHFAISFLTNKKVQQSGPKPRKACPYK